MIRSLDNLIGYQIAAANGPMGTVADFFFVDDEWKVRYLVVAAGGWLNRRRVLLSIGSVTSIDDEKRQIHVGLTRELVFASPAVETDMPVTRQNETLLARHYGWQPYWTPDPFFAGNVPSERLPVDEELEGANPHLRSFREITTYAVHVEVDGVIGQATDLIANDGNWHVDGLVASRDADAFFIPPSRIRRIDWTHRQVRISADAGDPPLAHFDSHAPVNPRPVIRYFDYTGRLHHTQLLPEVKEKES